MNREEIIETDQGQSIDEFAKSGSEEDLLQYISEHPNLQELDLSECGKITDASIPYLSSLVNLRFLNLDRTKVTDVGLASLSQIPRLDSLVVSRQKVTDKGWASILTLSNLRSLAFIGCVKVSHDHLKGIENLENLEELFLSNTHQFESDDDFESLSRLSRLRTLLFENANELQDGGLVHISQLKALEKLTLASYNITDSGIEILASLVSLKDLSLETCSNITEKGLSNLGSIHLIRLNIGGTKITDANLAKVLQAGAFPSLQKIESWEEMPLSNAIIFERQRKISRISTDIQEKVDEVI